MDQLEDPVEREILNVIMEIDDNKEAFLWAPPEQIEQIRYGR